MNEEKTNLGRVTYVLSIQPRQDVDRTSDCSGEIKNDQRFRCVLNAPGHRSTGLQNGVSWDTGVLGRQIRSVKGCWMNSSGHRTTPAVARTIDRKTKGFLPGLGRSMYGLTGLEERSEDDGLTVSAHSQIDKAAV